MLIVNKGPAPQRFLDAIPGVLADYEQSRRNLPPHQLPEKTPYELLPSDAQAALKESLLKDQHYLCVYCMARIDITNMRVEHYFPQSGGVDLPEITDEAFAELAPENQSRYWERYNAKLDGARRSVEYRNMFAACTGHEAPGRKRRDWTCDKRKGNDLITVNPLNQHDIETISYQRDGIIRSSNPVIQRNLADPHTLSDHTAVDMTSQLNLNYRHLVTNRQSVLRSFEEQLRHMPAGKQHGFCIKYFDRLISMQDDGIPYAGVLIYFLRKKLRSYGIDV